MATENYNGIKSSEFFPEILHLQTDAAVTITIAAAGSSSTVTTASEHVQLPIIQQPSRPAFRLVGKFGWKVEQQPTAQMARQQSTLRGYSKSRKRKKSKVA